MSATDERPGFYERRIWFRGGRRGRFQISAAEWLRCRGDTIGRHSGHAPWQAVRHGEDVIRTWVVTDRARDYNTRRMAPPAPTFSGWWRWWREARHDTDGSHE